MRRGYQDRGARGDVDRDVRAAVGEHAPPCPRAETELPMNLGLAREPASPYDLRAPDLYREPHPLLHKMRVEAPVYFCPELESWVLTSYRDVEAVLNDDRLSVLEETKRIDALEPSDQMRLLPLQRSFELWMGRSREADNDRYQKLLRRHFTPAVADGLRTGVQAIADRLIDAGVRRGGMDVVNDLAHPMAMSVV